MNHAESAQQISGCAETSRTYPALHTAQRDCGSSKEKCESLGSYAGTGFTSIFVSLDFDTL